MLKICIITEFFPPDYAATGQLIEELSLYLQQYPEIQKVEVFTGQPSYAYSIESAPTKENRGNLRIQRSRVSQLWSNRIRGKTLKGLIFTIRAFLHILRNSFRHHVFLLTTAPPFLQVAVYLVNRICFGKISYVCLIYDLYPDIAINLGVISRHHWLSKFWLWMNHQMWKESRQIIVLSDSMKARIAEQYPLVTNKISVIHSWCDPYLIKPMIKSDNWFAQKYGLVDKFTVLYSGNMGRCHDMLTIIDSIEQLQNEPIQFVFIGDGDKLAYLQQQVNQLQLNNCIFLPYQEKQDLTFSLTACDLSLVSVAEGFETLVAPSKLYSALAVGKPVAVISPPTSYLRQLITQDKWGKGFDNGDSKGLANFIRELSQNSDLAEKMGKNARKTLETNYTPQIIAEEYLRVLINASPKKIQ
ncbi:glycosyltransferase family 4 protein [Geminocystis sp. CENA526]|uniref:glycosyltransferase family 4 protein n=1 Tax=Geminocystis sp. CENA526 TaxID=1355871 RepID=UPI003D701E07